MQLQSVYFCCFIVPLKALAGGGGAGLPLVLTQVEVHCELHRGPTWWPLWHSWGLDQSSQVYKALHAPAAHFGFLLKHGLGGVHLPFPSDHRELPDCSAPQLDWKSMFFPRWSPCHRSQGTTASRKGGQVWACGLWRCWLPVCILPTWHQHNAEGDHSSLLSWGRLKTSSPVIAWLWVLVQQPCPDCGKEETDGQLLGKETSSHPLSWWWWRWLWWWGMRWTNLKMRPRLKNMSKQPSVKIFDQGHIYASWLLCT